VSSTWYSLKEAARLAGICERTARDRVQVLAVDMARRVSHAEDSRVGFKGGWIVAPEAVALLRDSSNGRNGNSNGMTTAHSVAPVADEVERARPGRATTPEPSPGEWKEVARLPMARADLVVSVGLLCDRVSLVRMLPRMDGPGGVPDWSRYRRVYLPARLLPDLVEALDAAAGNVSPWPENVLHDVPGYAGVFPTGGAGGIAWSIWQGDFGVRMVTICEVQGFCPRLGPRPAAVVSMYTEVASSLAVELRRRLADVGGDIDALAMTWRPTGKGRRG